jgi:uncharacterized RDD family membrane protein YckC
VEDKHQFAGFWKRVAAYIIDHIILSLGEGVIAAIFFVLLFVTMKLDKDLFGAMIGIGFIGFVLTAHVLYFACFESSSSQATPGKMALGIVVTNASGGRIGFGRAVARNCARVISGLCLSIGYIICAFTDRRQTIHDLLAGTLVVNKNAPLRLGAAPGGIVMP